MAISQNFYPYEILFRLAKTGEVSGAHRRDLEVIEDTETGVVYSEKEGDPQPISGADMDAVLGVVNTSLVATVAQRDQTIAQLQDSVSQLQDSVSQLELDLSDKSQQLDDAQQTIAQLQQRIIELEQDLMNANQALDELQQLPEDASGEPDPEVEL